MRPAHAACRAHPHPNGNHPDAPSPTRTWPSTKPNTAKHQGTNRQAGTPTTQAAARQPAAYDAAPPSPASHAERRRSSCRRCCSRSTVNGDPSSVPGCCFTNFMRARPQSSHDCHHSPAGHSSGSKDSNSGGGAAASGGRRCVATSRHLLIAAEQPIIQRLRRHLIRFLPPATSRHLRMTSTRTQTNLLILILIRKRQSGRQSLQKQPVSTNLSPQRNAASADPSNPAQSTQATPAQRARDGSSSSHVRQAWPSISSSPAVSTYLSATDTHSRLPGARRPVSGFNGSCINQVCQATSTQRYCAPPGHTQQPGKCRVVTSSGLAGPEASALKKTTLSMPETETETCRSRVCAASKKGAWPRERSPRPHGASVLLLLLAARLRRRLARRMTLGPPVVRALGAVTRAEVRIGVGHWSSHPET
jgi:hypothetical protein